MKTSMDSQTRAIYVPVQPQLDQVSENIRNLPSQSGHHIDELLEHAVESGGKLVRPAVTLLAASFHPHNQNAAASLATSMELLHVATLLHDDTVDNSALRRGRATVSQAWGPTVAVLLGDYVFAVSATFVCQTGNIGVVRRFSETIMDLATGELSEHFSAHNWHQTVADYNQRTYNKTASLFCTAAECGAVVSGAPQSVSAAFKEYGYNLGMAFQITDDILDLLGSEAEMGKPVGNDLLQGTLTLPVLLFIQHCPQEPVIRRLLSGQESPEDLNHLVDIVRNSPIMEDAQAVVRRYREASLAALATLEKNAARSALEELTDYVTRRQT